MHGRGVLAFVSLVAACGVRAPAAASDAASCGSEKDHVDRAECAARRELARARSENDAVGALCERDKLAQIEAVRRARIERRDDPRMVEILDAKADELLYEVEHCVCEDPI